MYKLLYKCFCEHTIMKYSDEELKGTAIQIYGEMKAVVGDSPYTIRNMLQLIDDSDPEFDEGIVANLSGIDPQLAREALNYLRDNFDDVSSIREKVEISEELLENFGLTRKL